MDELSEIKFLKAKAALLETEKKHLISICRACGSFDLSTKTALLSNILREVLGPPLDEPISEGIEGYTYDPWLMW